MVHMPVSCCLCMVAVFMVEESESRHRVNPQCGSFYMRPKLKGTAEKNGVHLTCSQCRMGFDVTMVLSYLNR